MYHKNISYSSSFLPHHHHQTFYLLLNHLQISFLLLHQICPFLPLLHPFSWHIQHYMLQQPRQKIVVLRQEHKSLLLQQDFHLP